MRTTSPAAFTRATVVIAVKYSIVERPEKIDEIIYSEISSFLMLIKDHDRVNTKSSSALGREKSILKPHRNFRGLLHCFLLFMYALLY